MSYVPAHGIMGGKWTRGRKEAQSKDGAYSGGCQKLTDSHSCLQLPEHKSLSKLPAGILKIRCFKAHVYIRQSAHIYSKKHHKYIIWKRDEVDIASVRAVQGFVHRFGFSSHNETMQTDVSSDNTRKDITKSCACLRATFCIIYPIID